MNVTPHITLTFWSFVKKGQAVNDCWRWLGGKSTQGYGVLRADKINVYLAHRVSVAIHSSLNDSLLVLHSCDNPECCNPLHLSQGTILDNVADRVRKRRSASNLGEDNPCVKLTEKEVAEIFLAQKISTPAILAKRFNVDRALIYLIWKRKNWTHITNNLKLPDKNISQESKEKLQKLLSNRVQLNNLI